MVGKDSHADVILGRAVEASRLLVLCGGVALLVCCGWCISPPLVSCIADSRFSASADSPYISRSLNFYHFGRSLLWIASN